MTSVPASGVPHGYSVLAIHGFVEELVVNDDPEYQWIDKIRSQRASNEARQVQFAKLSGGSSVLHTVGCRAAPCVTPALSFIGELQRKIGLKVLEMGGNAVIG